MKRRFIKAIIFCLLIMIGGFLNMNTVKAASANIEITTDSSQVTVGDTVYVYITISSDTMFGDVEANLTYDEDILEYKSGVSFITGSSGFLRISDISISEGADNRKYALEFQALKIGKCEIEFSGSVMVYDYESGFPMSVSSNILELEVKPTQAASDNANLASLKISPVDVFPEFDKDVYEYSINVGHSIDKLVVVALPEDEKAIVQVAGNDFLAEGENKVTVTVKAESGNIKEYVINVYRESAPEDIVDVDPIIPDKKHGSFELVRVDNEIFAVYGGKYKLLEPSDDIQVPSGYSKTRIIISGISIDVYASDLDGDFLLIYAENELGQAGFYRYDKVEKTMQRYVEEHVPTYEPVDNIDEDINKSKEYRSNLNKMAIIIALLSALCVLLMILSIRLYMKARGFKDDDLR